MTRYTPNMTHAEYIAALNDELRELQARAKTSTAQSSLVFIKRMVKIERKLKAMAAS